MFANSSENKHVASKQASRQISIWEKSLGLRVGLQKTLDAANVIPLDSNNRKRKAEFSQTRLENIEELQEIMRDMVGILNSQVKMSKRDRSSLKRPRFENESNEKIWSAIEDCNNALKSSWVPIVNKWYSRIHFGSEKNRSLMKVFNKTVWEQIDEVMDDSKLVLEKSRVLAKDSKRIDFESSGMTFDEEVYDDRNFYYFLLQSFIQSASSADIKSEQLGKLRQLKSKQKNVDVRASKGRKIRYVVHPKLQNFMFPVPPPSVAIDRDALFASLFK